MIRQYDFEVRTPGRGFSDITSQVAAAVREAGAHTGVVTVFLRHTSASLILCENADPSVRDDLETFMARLAPDSSSAYEHAQEGPDDMPAHIRSILTQNSITMPIQDGRLAVGTWQGLYLWEHRHRAHRRSVLLTIIAE